MISYPNRPVTIPSSISYYYFDYFWGSIPMLGFLSFKYIVESNRISITIQVDRYSTLLVLPCTEGVAHRFDNYSCCATSIDHKWILRIPDLRENLSTAGDYPLK